MMAGEIFFLLLLLSGGIWLIYDSVRSFRRRLAMSRWPRVPGRVVEHTLHSRRGHYRPQFVVEYAVGNRTLRSTAESPTRSGYSNPNGPKWKFEKYPVGSTVDLFVDPAKAQRVYLWLPELPMMVAQFLGALLLFAVCIVGATSMLS